MVTLRKVLSLPMFATALALAWLLGRQTGVDGMALGLLVLSLFAVSLWWYGLRHRRGSAGWLTLAPSSLALAGLLTVGLPEAPSAPTASGEAPEAHPHGTCRTNRLDHTSAPDPPAFYDFTATRCRS